MINNLDTLEMMFHLAEGSVSIITEILDSINSVNLAEDSNTIKTWGGNAKARYSEVNSIKIGSTTKDSIPIHETRLSGPMTDGKFGPNYFGNRLIELDYDEQILVAHDALPQSINAYTKFDIEIDRGMMFLSGLLSIDNEMIEHQFLLHTGYGGRLLLDDQFVNKYNLDNKLETISQGELKDSHGNIIKTKKAILPAIRFQEHQFTELPIGFFAGAIGRQKMSVMGCDLIRRFNIIIDRANHFIYLKPNTNYESPYTK